MANKPIFDKLLIANRGEIACRVIQTCRKMGIKTVAVYSTADEQAKHVKMADEAVCVGPPTSAESYLRIDKIVDACLKTKANAVHPGYGFLSENGAFSAELKKNNIVFVGPDAPSIEAMGDKIESKRLAKDAGVTCIPGFIGEIDSHDQLLKVANEITYPVMVKASGGGGGKGMHFAYNDKECIEYFDNCKAEAMAAFGTDKMLVEKFIENPRHIEIQVIADRHGNTVYFPERECSVQRRNQKVLEEAPSMFIDPKTRKAMGEEAAAMARKVDYVTAGTVEMVVDPKKTFYFLEMNTRLQVEHPITEMITGVDLVEQMIRASAGLKLSVTQDDIKINGWATEARVYAEDPTRNFFPSIGRLTDYVEPEGEGVRVDSGILNGSQISVFYDPLISKLCTWGETRTQCLERMQKSLDEYVVRGLNHNVCLLRDVIGEERYVKGDLTTEYLKQIYPEGFKKAAVTEAQMRELKVVSAVARLIRDRSQHRVNNSHPIRGSNASETFYVYENEASHETAIKVEVTPKMTKELTYLNEETCEYDVRWGDDKSTTLRLTSNENARTHDDPNPNPNRPWSPYSTPVMHADFGKGKSQHVIQYVSTNEVSYQFQFCGTVFSLNVLTPNQYAAMPHMPVVDAKANAKSLLSPMPGVVVEIAVKEGDRVEEGQELMTLEAMKMRNKLRSEVSGKVKKIVCTVGKTVNDEELLLEFE